MLRSKNLLLIQSFRGIASLLVVLFHVSVNSKEILNTDFLGNFFAFGRSGVDIFFVLSGFIITYTSFREMGSSGRFLPFLKRRAIRIFPVYWIIVSFFLISKFTLGDGYSHDFDFTAPGVISTYVLFPNHTMVNGVSWTLSFELFFYLLFSLAFLIKNKRVLMGAIVVYVLTILAVYIFGYAYYSNVPSVAFLFSPLIIEFFAGVIVALVFHKISSGAGVLFIAGGAVLFLAGGILFNNNYFIVPGNLNRVLVFGIPALLMIAGAAAYENNRRVSVHNGLLLLGDASYSLYLLHLPLVTAGFKAMTRLNISNPMLINVVATGLIGVICLVSILFYKHIEKPLIQILKSRSYTVAKGIAPVK